MFSSKGLFSNIQCPYQDSCLLPKCLFRHPGVGGSRPEKSRLEESENIAAGHARQPASDQENEGRRKPETSTTDSKLEITVQPEGGSNRSSIVQSGHRRISPPLLRRVAENVPKPLIKQGAAQAKPVSKQSAQVLEKTPKAEGLNPRMLKQSPASHDLRYRLVKALHDQLVRLNSELNRDASSSEEALVLSGQALISMALDLEEKAAIEKASIYSNVVKNSILAYKRMTVKDWKEERARARAQEESLKTMNTPEAANSEPPEAIDTGLSEKEELAFLPRLYTPIANLSKHGYVSTPPSKEEIGQAKKGIEASKGWEVCDRCKARFQVFPGRREEDGALTSGGNCKYHWGKPYWQEISVNNPKGKREKKFRCCGQAMGDSTGCTQADSHVFKVSEVKRLAALMSFEKTPKDTSGPKNAVCIDGEMGYTVHGLELIRLTATSWPGGSELLDVLVRPIGEVLDLNSRFSGVWPQQMADAVLWTPDVDSQSSLRVLGMTETGTGVKKLRIVSHLTVARSLLFQHLSPQTPLIGHGLENDLNAVRLIHPTIVDTALLFPHPAGLPYRNGLKSLMLTHLHRHIQVVINGKMDGHDSKEDARAAGDLVRWKIGREWSKMKRDGWVLEAGQFVPPQRPEPLLEVPSGPRGKLSVEFLELDFVPEAGGEGKITPIIEAPVKSGMKRSRAEISTDDHEDGKIIED